MQPYLVHLMHKKDKNWNFWTNLAPKMVFLALFGPVKCQIQMGWPHLALPPAMPLRQVQMNVSLALAHGNFGRWACDCLTLASVLTFITQPPNIYPEPATFDFLKSFHFGPI